MAFPLVYSIVKIFLVAALFFQPSLSAITTQAFVNDICKEVGRGQQRDEIFCLDFFEQQSGGVPETTIEGLTQITITETLSNATNTIIFVSKLKGSSPPDIANLLAICEAGYNSLKDVYVDASFAFAQRDYRNVQFDEQKCPRFVQDCKNNVDGPVPQMRTVNKQMDLLVRISIATSNRLSTAGGL